jgi:hypothetical protein
VPYDGALIRDRDLFQGEMTMRTIKTFATIAMGVSLYLTTGLAQALVSMNGISHNGVTSNGLIRNGLHVNSLASNGLHLNGLTNNGLHINSLTINALALNGVLINGVYLNGTTLNDGPTPEVQRESIPFNGLTLARRAWGRPSLNVQSSLGIARGTDLCLYGCDASLGYVCQR